MPTTTKPRTQECPVTPSTIAELAQGRELDLHIANASPQHVLCYSDGGLRATSLSDLATLWKTTSFPRSHQRMAGVKTTHAPVAYGTSQLAQMEAMRKAGRVVFVMYAPTMDPSVFDVTDTIQGFLESVSMEELFGGGR